MDPLRTFVATSLPSSARVATGNGGLPRIEIASRLATAEVYFHGAHVTAWQPRHAAAPVLWMSRESFFEHRKPIRGGVPICFPWFGAHPGDSAAPSHGFARLADWTLTGAEDSPDGTLTLTFALTEEQASAFSPPSGFRIAHRISVGSQLVMALEVRNVGSDPFEFEEALHTYFRVEHIGEITVTGLERATYLDTVGGRVRRTQADGPIRFHDETDRIYDTEGTCVIHDPLLRRRVTVAKSGSQSTVVWNPWIDKSRAMRDFGDSEWTSMLCIETANVGAAAVRLEPGGVHTMTANVRVDPV